MPMAKTSQVEFSLLDPRIRLPDARLPFVTSFRSRESEEQ